MNSQLFGQILRPKVTGLETFGSKLMSSLAPNSGPILHHCKQNLDYERTFKNFVRHLKKIWLETLHIKFSREPSLFDTFQICLRFAWPISPATAAFLTRKNLQAKGLAQRKKSEKKFGKFCISERTGLDQNYKNQSKFGKI